MNQFIILLLSTYLASANIVSASCSRNYVNTSAPRWAYTWNEYYYWGSHAGAATGIANAAADWNLAQGKIEIRPLTISDDYSINDDDTLTLAGRTSWTTQSPTNTGCANKTDGCTKCMNANVIYQVTILLNWSGTNGIYDEASSIGWTIAQTVEETMSHEFGHSYALAGDYVGTPDCTEPSVMSYVDPPNCSPNFFGPTSCDSDNFNSAYNGWSVDDYDTCGTCTTTSC